MPFPLRGTWVSLLMFSPLALSFCTFPRSWCPEWKFAPGFCGFSSCLLFTLQWLFHEGSATRCRREIPSWDCHLHSQIHRVTEAPRQPRLAILDHSPLTRAYWTNGGHLTQEADSLPWTCVTTTWETRSPEVTGPPTRKPLSPAGSLPAHQLNKHKEWSRGRL